jgi:hypothetical protein
VAYFSTPILAYFSAPVDSQDLTAAWSSLIRPAPTWGEDDWSPESERIHGIGRLQAQIAGRTVAEVTARLNADLAGHVIMTDHPEADSSWLWRAYGEVAASPAFELARPLMHSQTRRSDAELARIDRMDVDTLLTKRAADACIAADRFEAAAGELRAEVGIIAHRALDDSIGHALDLAALALIEAGRDHGDKAAASLRFELLRRAAALLQEYGRR